ncbi:hypothetical protein SUGI_1507330 [Cryptomeria japonica]|uniref:Uncharacterized protein n=1 Tax=Cryptomeria japonica TaxID=3369 RepID=A0AAD3RS62_CRYJA|nr:hypothetical protein SUGI_0427150 [Cryptomeria japonica]GLJ22684.1 hypothetical protein SUGI_0427290 [Cryptomeria japonica]GLJ58909.1 hypothetical protein SUGI_1483940 [Cryptomeria japonica]GLJ59408.1 hypothetical protein SUGI_1507330 [Cryptomeria japonica]
MVVKYARNKKVLAVDAVMRLKGNTKLESIQIIKAEGGLEDIFKLSLNVDPIEKLLKTSACYLSTSTGPIARLLFISTKKTGLLQ